MVVIVFVLLLLWNLSLLSIALKALRQPGLLLTTPDPAATLMPTATSAAVLLANQAGRPVTLRAIHDLHRQRPGRARHDLSWPG